MKILSAIVLGFCLINSSAQNLVPNHDFELGTTIDCGWINDDAEFSLALDDWTLPSAGTADLFSSIVDPTCWNYMPLSTYNNPLECVLGEESAQSGDSFAGIYTYGIKEYLQVELLSPLIVGETYLVSMWVSLADNIGYAASGIGIAFDDSETNFPGFTTLDLNPVAFAPNVINQTDGWVQIQSIYTATDPFSYLVIGNFDSDFATTVVSTGESCHPDNAYYYIDNVTVATASVNVDISGPDSICYNVPLSLFGTGGTDMWWANLNSPNDTIIQADQLDLNLIENTSFILTGTIGPSVAKDTINIIVSQPFETDLSQSNCEGEGHTFDIGGDFEIYEWEDGSNTSEIMVDSPGWYSITVTDDFNCMYIDSVELVWYPEPFIDLGPDGTACFEQPERISAGGSFVSYLWQDGSTDSIYLAPSTGSYELTVTDINGCIAESSVFLQKEICVCELLSPTAFSPNNDGTNDFYRMIYPCGQSEFLMRVFDRWGRTVFESNDINTGWDGTADGENCDLGVYVWAVNFINEVGEIENYKGNLTIIR